MQVAPGTVLAGKYRIEEILGEGGMGVVVMATHIELDQRVAIKLPRPEHVKEPTFAARFTREGKNAARIRNEHVARVLDVGRDDEGNPFLVMEYLDGWDLAKRLRTGQPFEIADAVDVALQACVAVAAAHAAGVVHRDLKPANLFLETLPDGSYFVKVLDFGISKVVSDSSLENALTNTTGIVGSPMYMSPEQMVSARDVDVRTDVFSLGLILFRILTGKIPWPATNPLELATRMAKEEPRTTRSFRPEVPEALDAVIMRAIARNREDRTATVAELARALEPFDPVRGASTLRGLARTGANPIERVSTSGPHAPVIQEASTMATSAITLHTVEEPKPPVETPSVETTAPSRRSPPRAAIIGGVAALIAIAGVIVFASRGGSKSPTPEVESSPPVKTMAAPKPTPTPTQNVVVEPPTAVVQPQPSAAPTPKPAAKPVVSAPVVVAPKPSTKPATKGSDPWGGW
jgi:eukaryotic-like serine/threonine-protein kinase